MPFTFTLRILLNEVVPDFTDVGPIALRAATAALPGNAVDNWLKPFPVGVKNGAAEEGTVPVRMRSMLLDTKNQNLFERTGPPRVPPKRLSTRREMVDFVQPPGAPAKGVTVPSATPAGQKPSKGLFSLLDRASPQFPW